jgi:hypothetical protein
VPSTVFEVVGLPDEGMIGGGDGGAAEDWPDDDTTGGGERGAVDDCGAADVGASEVAAGEDGA